jgi:LmbE family N-acetylglucosaminyl deacetylase
LSEASLRGSLPFAAGAAPIDARLLILVAHPDDEVLGLASLLPRLSNGILVHATDGAAAEEEGEATHLPALRFAELDEALRRLGADRLTKMRLNHPDGNLIGHAASAIVRVTELLAGVDVAITHAFEGGHPDHDACAPILDAACRTLEERDAQPPKRLEFPLYRLEHGGIRLATFPVGEPQGSALTLTEEQQARKRESLSAFKSQRHVVDHFPVAQEALRSTPTRDCLAPRPAQDILFAHTDEAHLEKWLAAARIALQ